jgi:uncharacterized protein (TIGR00251 family)
MSLSLPEALITEVADGIVIRLHLQPRASKTEICGIQGEELKVRVTSPPVDDAANKLCIEFFAKTLKIPKSALTIISGQKSRHKRLFIPGVILKDVSDLITTLCRPNH